MGNFKIWLENEIIQLPVTRQQKTYSCGAGALRAICNYFQVGPENEKKLRELLDTNYEDGTPPENIIRIAKSFGLTVREKHDMTLEELITHISKNHPVMVPIQAYGDERKYEKSHQSGHYVVAIGFDKEKIYFEDPALDGEVRGKLNKKEFLERWHDKDCDDKVHKRYGIIFSHDKYKPAEKVSKAKKIE